MGTTVTYARLSTDQILAECVGVTPDMIVAKNSTLGAIYVAYRLKNDPSKVVGLVVKVGRGNSRVDGPWTSYKEMDEEMGPCYYDASAKVLDALTPIPALGEPGAHEAVFYAARNAQNWRDQCRLRLAQRQREQNCVKNAKVGAKMTVTRDIKLANGQVIRAGSIVTRSDPRKLVFANEGGYRFRLRRQSVLVYLA